MSKKDGRLMGWGWRILVIWLSIIIIVGMILTFYAPSLTIPLFAKIPIWVAGVTLLGMLIFAFISDWTDTSNYRY